MFRLLRVFLLHCTSVGEVVLKDYAEELLAAVPIEGYHVGVSGYTSFGNMVTTHGTLVTLF